MELLSPFILEVHFAELFDTVDEEFQFFEEVMQYLDVLVVNRLVQQVIQAEPTRDDEHETFIELGRYVKECLVIILKLQTVVFDIVDHARLLLVKELPDLQHVLEMVSSHLVEVALLR